VSGSFKHLYREVQISKVHKLRRHLLDVIRIYGHLRLCSTCSSEAGHKVDKGSYGRPNKTIKTYTHQIVRLSQISQAVAARNAKVDLTTTRSRQRVRSAPGRPIRGVPRVSVGTLSLRLGLGRLSALLGQPAARKDASQSPGGVDGAGRVRNPRAAAASGVPTIPGQPSVV